MRLQTMKKMARAVILFSSAAIGAGAVRAQTAATTQENAKSYRLVWTITEMDGSKSIGTQHFAMIVVSGQRTMMKLGSKVPVVTGSYNPNSTSAVQTQFQYIDVGLNIDASLDQAVNGLKLRSKVEQSSVAEEKVTGDVREPVIRQAVLEGTSLLSLNKPLRIGSLDVPGSSRHLDVEVELADVR